MKKILILILIFISVSVSYAAKEKLLVAGFVNQSGEDTEFNEQLSISMIELLNRVPDYQLVPYVDLAELNEEYGLWGLSEVDSEIIDAMGLLSGAKKVITGSYRISDGSVSGTYEIYDMVNWEVIRSGEFTGTSDTISDITGEICRSLIGRELNLTEIELDINSGSSYAVYVNGQFEGIADSSEIFIAKVLAGFDSIISLKIINEDTEEEIEVFRETVNVEENEQYTIQYEPSAVIKVVAFNLPEATVIHNGIELGTVDENGEFYVYNIPVDQAQSVQLQYKGKEVDTANLTLSEGEEYIWAVQPRQSMYYLGMKFLEGGNLSAMFSFGFFFTHKLYMNIGGGIAYYNLDEIVVPIFDLELGNTIYSSDNFSLGLNIGAFLHISQGELLVSPLIRVETQWHMFYLNIGVRYSTKERFINNVLNDSRTLDLKPIAGIGVRFAM